MKYFYDAANFVIQTKEAKAKSFKQVYAKDTDAEIDRARTYHLNDEDRTEVDKGDVVEGMRFVGAS